MVRALLTIRVHQGRETEFEQAWRTIAERVRGEPGSIRQTLLRDPNESSTYMITSDWDSHDAFTRFERSPEQDVLTAPIRALRASASMTVMDVVEHVERSSQR